MYLLDDNGAIVDSEFSLSVESGFPCVVIESCGGSTASNGFKRRNPDYNKLLDILLQRLGRASVSITRIVLDSRKVGELPLEERTASLDSGYPIHLSKVNVDELRKLIARAISGMHRRPGAKSSGNSQKRIRIQIDRKIGPNQLRTRQLSEHRSIVVLDYAPNSNETEKEYLRKARIGQGLFRQKLLEIYDSTCPVTGISNPELLIASHIKPWSACTNRERLDTSNGIIFSALIDRLFDCGLITFDQQGEIVASPFLSGDDFIKCQLRESRRLSLTKNAQEFMRFHRTFQFQNSDAGETVVAVGE